MTRGFEPVSDKHKKQLIAVKCPQKATKDSVAYDFYTPVDLVIPPQEKVTVYSDIKAYMEPGVVLILVPRSSAGIKLDLSLANTIGVGESDFYNNPDNEGNYAFSLRNLRKDMELTGYKLLECGGETIPIPQINPLREQNTVHIKAGERVMQGFFLQTLTADNGNSDAVRVGGVGSTGK